ncbi:tRNA (N(6)-L-threonylcarbamoyladenosine(37)-C(2))-methylthiotransferase MtaB [candidate division NPL-UPA2 bacterium]|nr:tRNA (N(6)-L-threonylcarbamoyladenosine(37)-C(2))-methylthiotransferase MtaB [candidate division NPL-UPA2 bacterium]
MRERLEQAGYQVVSFHSQADIYAINTCTVTRRADQKSLQAIRAAGSRNPEAKVIATGCYAQTNPEEITDAARVDAVVGNEEKKDIVDIVEKVAGENPLISCRNISRAKEYNSLTISKFQGHTRAFVKIEDGCDLFCSYCKVPYARGPVRSRPLKDIEDEVRRLVERGYQEIVLTGINLGAYGRDFHNGLGLAKVIKKLTGIPRLPRLRLSSLEITEIGDDLVEAMASSGEKVCPHLHLPLQSGDDEVLKRMNRGYKKDDFLQTVTEIKNRIPHVSLSTDIMVGFPGERDSQFSQTLELVKRIGFMRLHVFTYSSRPGTARFPEEVPRQVKEERARVLHQLAGKLSSDFQAACLGERKRVLIEEGRDKRNGLLTGYSDDYLKVWIDGPDELMNRLIEVKVIEIKDGITLATTQKKP